MQRTILMIFSARKIISSIILISFALCLQTGCSDNNSGDISNVIPGNEKTSASSSDIIADKNDFDFTSYESPEISGIEKISEENAFSDKCQTFRFSYLSDSYNIGAYISIPLSCIENKNHADVFFITGAETTIWDFSGSMTLKNSVPQQDVL